MIINVCFQFDNLPVLRPSDFLIGYKTSTAKHTVPSMCFVVVKFLVTSGAMLHFNEQLQGLNNFFYLDPTWLCDVLSQVLIDSVSINNLSNSKNNCQLRKHHRLAIFINSNYAN